MKVRAKFKLHTKAEAEDGFSLTFFPVTSGSKENEEFFRYTPSGTLNLSTVNKDAAAQFTPGAEYYLDITPA
ncbi:MAG: hypothetical protein KDC27_10400 [Acidobacteria bacterium]|nr:hypothetical protein [Acidobacteriota bacterium]